MTIKEALERIKKSHYVAMASLGIEKPDVETEYAISTVENALETYNMIFESPEFEMMKRDIEAEKENFEEGYNALDKEVINAIIIAASRYRKYLKEVFFTIKDSDKWGIDFAVYCNKCSRPAYKEIVKTTITALEQMAFNIEGYEIQDNPDMFALEDLKEAINERENRAELPNNCEVSND